MLFISGTKDENVEKPVETMMGHDDDETLQPNANKGFITFKKIREEFPDLVKNISVHGSRIPTGNPSYGLGIGTLFNTLLGGVHSLYQDLLNRQQAFINLLTCGNCVNEGWDAIVDVALTVPELEWVYKPSDKSPTTFFTAVHQNGTVTGIGGSVVNGRPIAEYAFGNDGIKRYLTEKQKIKSSG